VKRLTRVVKSLPLGSRPQSRPARVRASLHDAYARLITGLAAVALVLAAGTSGRLQRNLSSDTLHAMSPAAMLPLLHSVPSHRLALEPRLPVHSSTGLGAALPAFAEATRAGDRALSTAVAVCVFATASVADHGYDATAPPALS
jgi:hypothetical protein